MTFNKRNEQEKEEKEIDWCSLKKIEWEKEN